MSAKNAEQCLQSLSECLCPCVCVTMHISSYLLTGPADVKPRQDSETIKSAKAMYEAAKALAIAANPQYILNRSGGKAAVGYALRRTDIKRLYAKEGYNVIRNKGIIDEHIRIWVIAERAFTSDDRVFFILSPEDLEDGEAIRRLKNAQDAELVIVGLDWTPEGDRNQKEAAA